MTKREELAKGYEQWLSQYPWEWFVTLTFRGFPPIGKAQRLFRHWIAELQIANGNDRFIWVRVVERRISGGNLHFHALVGGLRDRSDRWSWMRRWQEIAGEIEIAYFHQDQGGISYILKTLDVDGDFDIEFGLDSVELLPSRSGGRP